MGHNPSSPQVGLRLQIWSFSLNVYFEQSVPSSQDAICIKAFICVCTCCCVCFKMLTPASLQRQKKCSSSLMVSPITDEESVECVLLFIWCSSLFLTVVLQHVAQSYQVGSISESSPSQRSFEKTGGCHSCVSKFSCFDC